MKVVAVPLVAAPDYITALGSAPTGSARLGQESTSCNGNVTVHALVVDTSRVRYLQTAPRLRLGIVLRLVEMFVIVGGDSQLYSYPQTHGVKTRFDVNRI